MSQKCHVSDMNVSTQEHVWQTMLPHEGGKQGQEQTLEVQSVGEDERNSL